VLEVYGISAPLNFSGCVVRKNKNEAIDREPYGSQTIASIQNPSSTAKWGAFAITFSRCGAEAQVR